MRILSAKPVILIGAVIVFTGMVMLSVSSLWFSDQHKPDVAPPRHVVPAERDREPSVLTLNGEPVSRQEFIHVLKGEMGAVFAQFSREHNIASSKDFWYKQLGKTVPAEVLKKRVLEKLRRIKMEQILMKQHGIVEDISFSGFLTDVQAENARRKAALEKKQPIYGPIRFETKAYYDILHKNRLEVLCNVLATGELRPVPEELEEYYIENRDELPDRPLKEIRDVVRNRLIRKKCEERITKSLEKAEWDINQDIYSSIRVEKK